MRIAVVGAVWSTREVIKHLSKLPDIELNVYGLQKVTKNPISGFVNLEELCQNLKIPYTAFKSINDHASEFVKRKFDLIFVVGLSQLVCDEIINAGAMGCIGFHPTLLPSGRGRAPVAWMLLNAEPQGAATFFMIEPDTDPDSGELVAQVSFDIDKSLDTVETLEFKISNCINEAMEIISNNITDLEPIKRPQDHSAATIYTVRKPTDGIIDWNESSSSIDRLIRASTAPHPGAFICNKGDLINVLSCKLPEKRLENTISGIAGRVMMRKDKSHLIKCGQGALWVTLPTEIPVGFQFTTVSINVIHEIYSQLGHIRE